MNYHEAKFFYAPTDSSGGSGMDLSMQQNAELRQRQLPIVGTEIYENAPLVKEFTVGPISENITSNPNCVTFIVVAAESGVGKAEIIAGIINELEKSAPVNENLANSGMQLQIHYTSTAKCAKYAENRGRVRKGYWGKYDPITEFPQILKFETHGAIFSEVVLPESSPKKKACCCSRSIINSR